MSDKLPRHPDAAVQEDLQEAAFATLRQVLEEAKALPDIVRRQYLEPLTEALFSAGDWRDEKGRSLTRYRHERLGPLRAEEYGIVRAIDQALAGDPGRTFLEHLRRLEAENAELRTDVPAYLAENLRIRNLLVALESCPHGCQDAGFCPHYARLRRLGLRP